MPDVLVWRGLVDGDLVDVALGEDGMKVIIQTFSLVLTRDVELIFISQGRYTKVF